MKSIENILSALSLMVMSDQMLWIALDLTAKMDLIAFGLAVNKFKSCWVWLGVAMSRSHKLITLV